MLKMRRSRDRLIFNMGIPIPGKDRLYIETGSRFPVPAKAVIIPYPIIRYVVTATDFNTNIFVASAFRELHRIWIFDSSTETIIN